MNPAWRRAGNRNLLPLVLGLSDGILNALVLAGGAIAGTGGSVDLALAARVGTVALVTGFFTVLVAQYADERAGLLRATRQLNVADPMYLARTKLGRDAALNAWRAAVLASVASFVGSALPLLAGAILPGWATLAAAIGGLAALGIWLAGVLHGSRLLWAASLAVGGVIVAIVGIQLRIV